MTNVYDLWDRLIVMPMFLGVALAFACLVQVLASPRVFRRAWRRIAVSAALALYIVLMLIEAPRSGLGVWFVDALTVVRWSAQIVPMALCLWLMRKMETLRTEEPMRRALWTK